jgi:hypothetical protein
VLIQAGAGGYSLAGGQVILKGGIGGTGIMVGQPDDGAAGTAGILIATVPEPSSLLLLGISTAGLLGHAFTR